MIVPLMPSQAYVAQQLYKVDQDGPPWDEASQEDINAHMLMARVAIAAIQSWQALHRPDGRSDRYYFNQVGDEKGPYAGWGIFDRKTSNTAPLGIIHDALLAQQIVDDLNKRDGEKKIEVKA